MLGKPVDDEHVEHDVYNRQYRRHGDVEEPPDDPQGGKGISYDLSPYYSLLYLLLLVFSVPRPTDIVANLTNHAASFHARARELPLADGP